MRSTAMLAAVALAVVGCSDDGGQAEPAATEDTGGEGENDGDEPDEPAEPEEEPVADWDPADPDSVFGLMVGDDTTVEDWAAWIDCHDVSPREDWMANCRVPTPSGWAPAALFVWEKSLDRDDYDEVDDTQWPLVWMPMSQVLRESFLESTCDRGEVEVVYVTMLAPGVDLMFPWAADEGPEPRRVATALVRDHVDTAFSRAEDDGGGLDHRDHTCPV